MKRRFTLLGIGLGAALIILTAQVWSDGTCNYSITGGSASIVTPTSGECYVVNDTISAKASYGINWQVNSITPSDQTSCSASVSWSQSGSSNETGNLCNFSQNSTDSILNANVGSTGSFSRTDSWTCTATTLGNWILTVDAKQGSTTDISAWTGYSVKTSCP